MKMIRMFFTLAALLFLEAAPLTAQIPASELPPPGTDSGLDGKYDPENGIAQLIRDKSAESAASKIFEDEHVLVFMPLPQEEVVAPGTCWWSRNESVRGTCLISSRTNCGT